MSLGGGMVRNHQKALSLFANGSIRNIIAHPSARYLHSLSLRTLFSHPSFRLPGCCSCDSAARWPSRPLGPKERPTETPRTAELIRYAEYFRGAAPSPFESAACQLDTVFL